MNFRPELADKVMAGEKTVTRRLVSDNPRSPWHPNASWPAGKQFAVCPGRGKDRIGDARVVSARVERLGLLDDAEARREGFENAGMFEAVFWAINDGYDQNAQVWRIEFEPVRAPRERSEPEVER